ncbi:SDR family oxidoreductase [Teredinibacter turnerae]|uniref:SDR family oxidoreductase n=1 Tax=Teredinibacter turnerae TaxID=2426 RepID=UPI00041AE093|nr:SDR family oxidoreductase [Teredinibacter turnerae]
MKFAITGGSRGIGAATVLAAVDRGHDVVFTYRSNREAADQIIERAKLIREDVLISAYELDVKRSDKVEAFASFAAEKMGGVDVVVPNAGINRNNLAMSMSDEEWQDVIDTNLSGAFYVVRAFLPELLAQRFGRIIFVSSLSRNGLSGQANYAASKAGLVGLARTIAKEYGHKGITSNVVAPGLIETDMTRENMSDTHHGYWEEYSPSKRMGLPEEVVSAILFFSSEEASFINGTCLPITAGLDWVP